MAEVDWTLMIEMAKEIRDDMTFTTRGLLEVKNCLLDIREEIHNLSSHVLRMERHLIDMNLEIDRLNARTGLVDA